MQSGNLFKVQSLATVNFLSALATNAGQYEDLALPQALGAGRVARCRLRSITLVSTENLAWELWLLSKTGGTTANADTDPTRGFWSWAAGDAKRVAGAGLFHYYIDGLDVAYEDEDRAGGAAGTDAYLHCCLVNRSVGAKTANAGGALTVRFMLEPSFGF
jgi:hypothetical protein